jgi:ribosomal protein S18 acetylase RimI-like enzyme
MTRTKYSNKRLIVNILSSSFEDKKSVNYILKQDKKRVDRIKNLMEYSFDMCYYFGEVFLSDDKKGCALILLPDKKKTNLKSILLDMKLIISCIGLSNVTKAMDREARIKKLQPTDLMYYLWFIGVDPKEQNRGIGSGLLGEIIKEGFSKGRPVYLETSTVKNIPWYEKFGFKIYNELDLSYRLFFMKNDN